MFEAPGECGTMPLDGFSEGRSFFPIGRLHVGIQRSQVSYGGRLWGMEHVETTCWKF